MNQEFIGKAVLDAAFKVHTKLGPGLLESVYEAAVARELRKMGHGILCDEDQMRDRAV